MSSLKKWIIILVILVIIIIGTLIYTIYQNRGRVIYGVDEQGSDVSYNLDETIQKVSIRNDFYIVRDCVNKFFLYYTALFDTEALYQELDEDSLQETKEINAQAIYDLLDSEYIKAKDITHENVSTKLEKKLKSTINITNMYVSQKTPYISVYIINGKLKEYNTGKISDFQMLAKLDSNNRTFSIIPQDYMNEKYNNIQIGEKIDIEVPENIVENTHNTYTFNAILDEKYVKDLFSQFKIEIQNYTEVIYNRLDEEYRNKKFGTFEEFQNYIEKNKEKYLNMQLDKYQKTVTDDYIQYMCIDKNRNYYIFRENAVMDYSVILDIYTIDLPEFVEKYNVVSENEKISLNIQKIFRAIEEEDYKYVYSKLDETFKNNNFTNYTDLEKYFKSILYENSSFEYKNVEKQASVYSSSVIIKNSENNNENRTIKIIMKLAEGTDFNMSFSIEE